MPSEPVEAEIVNPEPQTMAVARIQSGAVNAKPLTVDEIGERLKFIRRVMQEQMKEGQDYGKIPGTGDKPSLLQPGAQKLLLTFNLREQLKKEVLREYPGWHREYEIVVTVFPAGQRPEDGWDGVGTCSTLESKYRYRKAERRCPACNKTTIIKGKEEYGGGFVCFKKKGGCGAKFTDDDQRITSQAADDVENEDPADTWNTVRKMAFKRALVAAAINATNTSELWTQDVEDMAANAAAKSKPSQAPPKPAQAPKPAPPAAKPAPPTSKPVTPVKSTMPTDKTKQWVLEQLEVEGLTDLAVEYYRKLTNPAVLMPNETLVDLGLRFVPASREQLRFLIAAITDFGNGDEAKHAFAPHTEPAPPNPPNSKPVPPRPAPAPKPAEPAPRPAPKDPEWWRDIIVPVPNKGQKRADYIVNPDTIGSLYDQCKQGNEPSCKRLYGFVGHFEAKPWTGHDGKQRPPSDVDTQFREALDAFAEWHDKNGNDTAPPKETATADPAAAPEEEKTPFD